MKMIFLNIGWMKYYKGINSNDPIIDGSASYLKENADGYEKYNFLLRDDEYYYGYARIKKSIRLQNIIPRALKEQKIDNVTVIFFSKQRAEKKPYIVGWYLNATLYRTSQLHDSNIKSTKTRIKGNIDHELEEISYICKTNKDNAFLVPEHLRDFEIPYSKDKNSKGGYGQSTNWYADNMCDNGKFINSVIAYINEKSPLYRESIFLKTKISSKKHTKQISHEEKTKIEKIAIQRTINFYESRGFKVNSVESENCGWDLVASKAKQKLYLEVKGRGAEDENTFQLTPNEYSNLKKFINIYRVVLVNNCLGKNPNLTVYKFEYSQQDNKLYGIIEDNQSERKKKLIIEELVYAKGMIVD